MPKQAIDYIKSLEEFDAEIFKKITGLDSENDEVTKAIKLLEERGKLKDGKILTNN